MNSLREQMPETAAFLDALRDAFGKDAIDAQVRAAFAGAPTFWAMEGRRLGVRITEHTCEVYRDARDMARARRARWMDDAQEVAQRMGIEIPRADVDDHQALQAEAQALREMIASMRRKAA
ncbi:MAG TPA: hypothetical protein VM406_09885 [Noviherbaspirillum sp.]|nr:hypothetical protein [Noviherbaspirillum sp.]